MKFSTVLAGAFAAFATAAPATTATTSNQALDKRLQIDASKLNGLKFKQDDLNYLLNINALDLTLFQNLGIKNNLNILVFQELFQAEAFNLAQLLQFQQLNTLLVIAGTGALNTFDLASLNLDILNLGLISDIGSVELTQFVNQAFVPQIQSIAKEGKFINSSPPLFKSWKTSN